MADANTVYQAPSSSVTTTVSSSSSSVTSGDTTTTTTTKNTTTTQNIKYDNGVLDISIIPYMRRQKINFNAKGLRPNRRVWFFFDSYEVTNWIVPADEMVLNQKASAIPIGPLNAAISFSTGNVSSIVGYSRFYEYANANTSLNDTGDDRDRNRKLYLDTYVDSDPYYTSSATLNYSGNTVTPSYIDVKGGAGIYNISANTYQIAHKGKVIPDNYWGANGANNLLVQYWGDSPYPGFRANILSYTASTRTIELDDSSTYTVNLAPNLQEGDYTDIVNQYWRIDKPLMTDDEGNLTGTLWLPGGTFRTGERIFRIIDTPTNDLGSCTTYVDYKFDSSGLQQVKQTVDLTNRSTKVDTTVNSQTTKTVVQTVTNTVYVTNNDGNGGGFGGQGQPSFWDENPGLDPIAESFFVSESQHPDGVFITALDIFFRSKDNIVPVKIEIRPMVNGYPSATDIIQNGVSVVSAENVLLSDDASVPTKFVFETPVFVPPGQYCFVVRSDSLNYEIFVSELGQTIIGSTSIVSKQPYLGSLFKSQNASTWDAIQNEDITFTLYIAQFTNSGQLNFSDFNLNSADVAIDDYFIHVDSKVLGNSGINWSYSNTLLGASTFTPDNHILPPQRVHIPLLSNGHITVAGALWTGNPDISPIVYANTGKIITVKNHIDNANLAQSDFVIVNAIGGFPANTNIPITITSKTGSGAVAYANSNSSGYITSVQLTSSGAGYTDNVSATVGSNTVIAMAAETNPSGGPVTAKYISRTVTLANGFDANDLKVFLTAYKPAGTDIQVYYKVKSSQDPDPFFKSAWTRMYTKAPIDSYEGDYTSAIEYQFSVPGTEQGITGITYTKGSATYTYFNQFAIKIDLLSQDTRKYPIVYDARAIALPL